jgi:hypothetical protein
MAEAARPLASALGDAELREQVAPILQKLGKNAVPELLRLLRSPDDDTRISACKVIARIGRPAFDAGAFMPLSMQIRMEVNPDVFNAMKDAIESIQKK